MVKISDHSHLKALQESEKKYRELFETMAQGVVYQSADGTITSANPAAERILGLTLDQMQGHTSIDPLWKAIHKDGSAFPGESHPAMETLRTRQAVHNAIMGIFNPSTEKYTWIKVSSIPKFQEGNESFIEVVTTFEDITELKLAEDVLRERKKLFKDLSNQFEAILDHLPCLVFYKDKKNNFIRVNQYLALAHRKSKEELEGKNLTEFYPPEVAEQYYQDDLSVINSGIAKLNIVEPWETAEGSRWVSTSKIPFVDLAGEIIGVIGISIDITEHKLSEAEIRIKNEELLKLNAEKDKFFSIIAHDLRSPFNSFLGFTQIMVENSPKLSIDEIQKIAVLMRKSAVNLYGLLENLLEWSQLQRGIFTFAPKPIVLRRKITEIMQPVLASALKKGIDISYDIPENLIVVADDNMLGSIIRNLTSNAIKFTPKQGKIKIAAKYLPNDYAEISVSDTGIGMSSKIMKAIFQYNEQTNRKGTEGEPITGLGLIISKEFIEKHGGKIWVESVEGKGSLFRFDLPNQS